MAKYKPSVIRKCENCDKDFRVFQNLLDKGKGRFCSRKCYCSQRDQSGKNNPNWRENSKPRKQINAEQRERHPEKYAARLEFRKAVMRGDIIRQPCEKCGKEKTEGHHSDYSKPLDVIWLCKKHHTEIHNDINEARK